MTHPYKRPPRDGEPSRDDPIEWFRWYVSEEQWRPIVPGDDYRIFGSLWLSDLRAVLQKYDEAVSHTTCENVHPNER